MSSPGRRAVKLDQRVEVRLAQRLAIDGDDHFFGETPEVDVQLLTLFA